MTYEDLVILIPSHSLEDFPTDVGEDDAAGLLNAFAVVWHPIFLAEADRTDLASLEETRMDRESRRILQGLGYVGE